MLTGIASKIRSLSEDIESCLTWLANWRFEGFEKKFHSIEKEYELIKKEVITRSETGRCLLSFIRNKENHIKNNNSLEDITRKSWVQTQCWRDKLQDISGRIQLLSNAYCQKKGRYYYETNRIEEALDMWEEVLKIEPDNEYIHSKLHEIVKRFQFHGNSTISYGKGHSVEANLTNLHPTVSVFQEKL